MKPLLASLPRRLFCFGLLASMFSAAVRPQTDTAKNVVWKQVAFAILKFNDAPPKSWNIYHTEKRGWILARLWKRYLLISLQDQEVYDIDPQTLTPKGD